MAVLPGTFASCIDILLMLAVGCIVVVYLSLSTSSNTGKGFLSSSKKHVIALSEAITDCDDRQEMVWVSVSEE